MSAVAFCPYCGQLRAVTAQGYVVWHTHHDGAGRVIPCPGASALPLHVYHKLERKES